MAGSSPAKAKFELASLTRVKPADFDFRENDECQAALRLGFRQIKGFIEIDAERLVAARGAGYPDRRRCGDAAGSAAPHSNVSRRPTPFARSGSIAAARCGR